MMKKSKLKMIFIKKLLKMSLVIISTNQLALKAISPTQKVKKKIYKMNFQWMKIKQRKKWKEGKSKKSRPKARQRMPL